MLFNIISFWVVYLSGTGLQNVITLAIKRPHKVNDFTLELNIGI